MSWQDDVDELNRQKLMAEAMGGPEGVAFQHGRNKLTVRERIDILSDAGSFQEIGALAGTASWEGGQVDHLKPSNTVIGTCNVDSRKVAFSGGDFIAGTNTDFRSQGACGYGPTVFYHAMDCSNSDGLH